MDNASSLRPPYVGDSKVPFVKRGRAPIVLIVDHDEFAFDAAPRCEMLLLNEIEADAVGIHLVVTDLDFDQWSTTEDSLATPSAVEGNLHIEDRPFHTEKRPPS